MPNEKKRDTFEQKLNDWLQKWDVKLARRKARAERMRSAAADASSAGVTRERTTEGDA